MSRLIIAVVSLAGGYYIKKHIDWMKNHCHVPAPQFPKTTEAPIQILEKQPVLKA